jgi:PPM family protein phosphatase
MVQTGQKNRSALPRDHNETVLGHHFACVTDRGNVHSENEDAVSIVEADLDSFRAQIAVVCDGVSSSQHAAAASLKAVSATCQSLVRLIEARVEAIYAVPLSIVVADREVRKMPFTTDHPTLHPPGATVVAAVVLKGWLTIGWIGDSRCYWVDDSGVQLLTHDHSWVNLVVDAGVITKDIAEKRPDAHRISRCLGPIIEQTSNEEMAPAVARFRIKKPGRALLCTDGLWNYISSTEQLAAMVSIGRTAPSAIDQARALVQFAIMSGGKDNVTAVIISAG